ncbi:uncharacterized mitochondrial protein AtMg00860-like [Bufo gargarizans]|uniref:uncharacterized mitochondrial protein AtMg00860-like n=1 Tax=Bufo gargarizans TaxID=30331 RepID=UPI001CF102E3|nr:uncharacterized mitochondrial protein AtMg00860-like [Bufo gargarizans]
MVFSPDLNTHRRHVRLVLQRLRENRLYAKLEKCTFEKMTVPFLGYIISDAGLQMDSEKLNAVKYWPRPQGLRAIQCFLGLANFYRQFILNFSSLTSLISDLTRKGVNAKDWPPEADAAFIQLKSSFASAPIL